MRRILAALLLVGCSSPSTWEGALFCGWMDKGTQQVETDLEPGECWELDPPDGLSVMPEGADACDASDGQGPSIWCPGQTFRKFSKFGTSGKVNVPSKLVACPSTCP